MRFLPLLRNTRKTECGAGCSWLGLVVRAAPCALLLLSWAPVSAADLLVAAASDLAPLTSALENGFKKSHGAKVRFTLGSSGSLARQIENGAPFDVYLSASEQYVKDLASAGYADPQSITRFALGRIAVWSPRGLAAGLADLRKPAIRHIALANPDHAPYGAAARQALERQRLWGGLQDKIVYGENVRQALQFADSGNADAVITSWTLLKGKGTLIPSEFHDPIRQAGAVVKGSAQAELAKGFLRFLLSREGREILENGGLFPP